MSTIFTTSADLLRWAQEQLSDYPQPEKFDTAVEKLMDLIRNAEGFSWGKDVSEIVDALWHALGEQWGV